MKCRFLFSIFQMEHLSATGTQQPGRILFDGTLGRYCQRYLSDGVALASAFPAKAIGEIFFFGAARLFTYPLEECLSARFVLQFCEYSRAPFAAWVGSTACIATERFIEGATMFKAVSQAVQGSIPLALLQACPAGTLQRSTQPAR